MIFWSKSWKEYRKIFFLSETISISFSSERVSYSFDNNSFFWNEKTVSAKSQAKVKVQVFLKQISSLESLRHVESSFDNLAPLSSQNILKVFYPNHERLEKVYSFRKDFNSIKSSSRNAKCNFGNPAESLSREVRKNCEPIPKINRRLFPSLEKLSSKRSSMDFACSIENDDPILWKKSKYICSKFEKISDPKNFLEPHSQIVPLDPLKGTRTKLRENCCQKSDNFSVKVRKEV